MSGPEILFVALAALVGGAVQSVLGFGVAFTTVPALAVVAPELIPGAPLVAFLPISLTMGIRERVHIDRDAATRVAIARVPGTVLGTIAVLLVNSDGIATGVALILIAAVISTALGWSVPITRTNEHIAGAISGFSGTATGLGGPPLAVLYRERSPQQVRPTLAAVFVPGILLSLVSLGVTGSLTVDQVQTGALLAIAVTAGLVLASPLLTRLSDQTVRAGLLLWAGGGSVVALLRVVLG